ncbi:MAG: IS5 family transposase, partial [Saprospiraceae bacterium]
VDYQIMESRADSQIVEEIANRVVSKYKIESWSFDKGYWHKDNKEYLSTIVGHVIMPKKGKCNKEEAEYEHTKTFKKIRNQHSVVESNINELEHCGLDRCPDRGYTNYKKYISLGICAYNLHKIGKELQRQKVAAAKKLRGKAS